MRRKDITKIGSKNPGTMNMLRSFGFGLAFLAFIGEVLKAGLLCLLFKFLIPGYGDLTYFISGFFIILGYDYPAWNKFKGGKGVACFVGIFLFSSLWYVGIIWFLILFFLFIYIDYAFVMSFMYIGGMSIAYTIFVWVCGVPYAWAITLIIWLLVAITVFKHRGNIKRLATGQEKKIGFKSKLKKFFKHKKGEFIIDEENVENKKPEKIIVVYDNEEQNQEKNLSEEKSKNLDKDAIDKQLYDEIMKELAEKKKAESEKKKTESGEVQNTETDAELTEETADEITDNNETDETQEEQNSDEKLKRKMAEKEFEEFEVEFVSPKNKIDENH